MLNFLERVELHLRCIVIRGAGGMDTAERNLTIQALTEKYPVPPDPAWRIRSYLAGCRLDAQFEPRCSTD